MKKNVQDYLFFKKLTSLPFISSIYLFGSRARSDNKERSDIDIAIECPDASKHDWLTVMDIIEEADTLLMIDCIRLDTLKDQKFRAAIEKDKKLLYKKDLL